MSVLILSTNSVERCLDDLSDWLKNIFSIDHVVEEDGALESHFVVFANIIIVIHSDEESVHCYLVKDVVFFNLLANLIGIGSSIDPEFLAKLLYFIGVS